MFLIDKRVLLLTYLRIHKTVNFIKMDFPFIQIVIHKDRLESPQLMSMYLWRTAEVALFPVDNVNERTVILLLHILQRFPKSNSSYSVRTFSYRDIVNEFYYQSILLSLFTYLHDRHSSVEAYPAYHEIILSFEIPRIQIYTFIYLHNSFSSSYHHFIRNGLNIMQEFFTTD